MSSSAKILAQALKSQQAWARTAGTAGAYWVFPGLLTAGWLLWPALDQEWLQSIGMATDPSLVVKQVQEAKVARMEAHMKAKGIEVPSKAAKEEEEEEEEEEEAPAPEEEEEPAPADEEEDDGGDEGGDEDDEGDDDDDDEDVGPPPKPLYDPVKGDNLTSAEMWDNFTIKAVRMNDEDDDDDEDGK